MWVVWKVSAKSESWHHWCVSMLFSASSVSWRNTHQVSAESVYYSVFGIRLNWKSRVISKKWKKEFRVLIKHYFMKGKSPQETKEKLDKHYGKSAPSISMVYKWFQDFRSGHMSTSDAELSEGPVEATTPEIVDKIQEMVMDDRRVKLLVLCESRVNGYIILYINIWTWESYSQDGCRDNSQLTKNEIVWGVPRTICSCVSGIHRTLGVVSSLWTKHGYTTTLLRPRNSENNGFPMGSLHQRRWTPFLQRGRIWWQTFGICKEQFRSTIWKRVKLLQVHPIHRYWTVWKSSCKKNVHDWPTKNPFPTQRTSSLLWSCGRKIDGVRVPTRSTSPLFSRFGSLGLLLVLQYEKMAGSISTPIWRRVQ